MGDCKRQVSCQPNIAFFPLCHMVKLPRGSQSLDLLLSMTEAFWRLDPAPLCLSLPIARRPVVGPGAKRESPFARASPHERLLLAGSTARRRPGIRLPNLAHACAGGRGWGLAFHTES